MIRPFRDEVERYGHYSLAAESMYDHPFQWGSKRTGPDLARVGGKYSERVARGASGRPARASCPNRSCRPTPSCSTQRARRRRHRRASAHQPRRRRALHGRDDREGARPTCAPRPTRTATTRPCCPLPQGRRGRLRRPAERLTEMDALVAYLQILGRMVDFTDVTRRGPAAVGSAPQMAELYGSIQSLWLVWCVLLFVGIVAWVFWPGASAARGPWPDPVRGRRGTLTMASEARGGATCRDGARRDPGQARDQGGAGPARLRQAHGRARVGRHPEAGLPAAALVGADLLGHLHLRGRLVGPLSLLAGLQQLLPRHPRLRPARRGRARSSPRPRRAGARSSQRSRRAPLEQIQADPELLGFALAGGEVVFNNNCAQCHGARRRRPGLLPDARRRRLALGRHARGRSSTPSPTASATAATRGPRLSRCRLRRRPDPDPRRRSATSPSYVLSLSGRARTRRRRRPSAAQALFAENCVACHGEGGAGMPELGAPEPERPDLALRRRAGARSSRQIHNPRHGVMPAFGRPARPRDDQDAAVYVHGLGGGQ